MANKRIHELVEDTTPASGDYIATDKSGEAAASKVNLNKLLLASGAVAGSASQAQDFAATGIKADVIAESTAAAGVTVDGVLLKDTAITLPELGSAPATPASGKWTLYTKASGVYAVDDAGNEIGPFIASAAPTDATYVVQTANGTLTNEQALSALSTGIVKVTTTTGVLSTAVAGTDYSAASHNHAAGDVTSGTLAHERGGLEADVSAYSGLVKISGGATSAVAAPSGAIVGTTDTQTLSGKTYTAPALTGQALTDAATTTMDCANGHVATWTIAGDRTFALSNAPTNGYITVAITQDGTGNRRVTWPSDWRWFDPAEYYLSMTPAAVDVLKLVIVDAVVYASITRDVQPLFASFGVTTTGAETLTINSLGVTSGQTVTIDWGDSSSNAYTGTASRTHDYAGAGTYTVKIYNPLAVSALGLADSKITLTSVAIAPLRNITAFSADSLKSDGSFSSAHIRDWRPTTFSIGLMPSGYAGTFNSADISDWRPTAFSLYMMPSGYAGTLDSADISDWRPTTFNVYIMPSGYAGTFDSSDVSDWRPTTFLLGYMPSGYTITTPSGGFSAWTTGLNSFQMPENGLSQAQVDTILWDLYQAATTPRTATGGTINVGGTNAAPSGTYQAPASCPVTSSTPGKEIAHALVNDGCAVGFNVWTTVTFTA